VTLINMLTWWQWGLLGAVPPAIVLLYFLKLKRTPLEVPSTYLWRKSIEDLHVNSIWQRLRTSMLLLLQILLALLVMAALVRPGWSGSKLVGDRYIFLVDNSASMQSTDVAPSRLAEAKRRVAELIEEMDSGDVAMIVSFSDLARVEQVFTDNRRDLIKQLAAIPTTNRTTSLQEALRVAAGLANAKAAAEGQDTDQPAASGMPATVYLFSDGRFADVNDFRLGNLTPVYVPIGAVEPANVGITAFTVRRREDKREQSQAFGQIENFGPQDLTVEAELYLNDALLDSRSLPLKARASGGLAFELGEIKAGVLKLQIRPGGVLSVDDQAWSVIQPATRSRVLLVTPGNDALTLALQTESASEACDLEIAAPATLTTPEYQQRASSGQYGLIIYDQCAPREMPRANTLFVGRIPPGDLWKQGAKTPAPQIIDVEGSHPLMQLLELGNIRFAEVTPLTPPTGASVLITTGAGPLLAIAPREGFEDAVLGAEIVGTNEQNERYANTDWPLRVSFPVFILNTLEYFGGTRGSASAASTRPGETVTLAPDVGGQELSVRSPSGRTTKLPPRGGEPLRFTNTDELGVYDVQAGSGPSRRFAVNLNDSSESNVVPRPAVEIGYSEITGQAIWEGGRQELWKPLLLLALCVLCVEWYIYTRRLHL
jgi:hypothetical protein